MLETEISEFFERQVAPELPAARLSIADAHRAGRARLRLRRTAAAVTPAAAPRHFSTLRPYVRLTWLPRGSVIWKYILWPTGEYLANAGQGRHDLFVYAAGQCHLGGQALICGQQRNPLQRVLGTVRGRPVYLGLAGIEGSVLTWQYATGGWAQLQTQPTAAAERTALRMAQGARFGPTVAAAERFPFQLTGETASWAVVLSGGTVSNHVLSVFVKVSGRAGRNRDVPQVTVQPAGTMQTCRRLVDFPASWYQASYRTIKGFPALLTLGVGQGAADGRSLCIPDADGVLLSFSGHANSSMVRLFEHHVRLLGPSQAHWTTKPLG